MFTLDKAPARIQASKQKGAEISEGDSTRRMLKCDIWLDIELTDAVIHASEAVMPILSRVCDLVAGDEDVTGLDIKPRAKLPVSAVVVWALDPKKRGKDGQTHVFRWNAVEFQGQPHFKIDKEGLGRLELRYRVTATKTDMQRFVDWLDADVAIDIKPSDPLGEGKDDNPKQGTIAGAIERLQKAESDMVPEGGQVTTIIDGEVVARRDVPPKKKKTNGEKAKASKKKTGKVTSIETARGAPDRGEHADV